ncbi:MAG: ribose 5-phosphate isomerase B [Candidatus Omnitrophota bacterium]
MTKIFIGSDHRGFILKNKLKLYLKSKGYNVLDLGPFDAEISVDYPDYACAVAKAVSKNKSSRGILICYSGIGNCISANKIPGIRAAVCYNKKLARLAREHNDTNILVLAAGFVSDKLAKGILEVWLKTKFAGGRHLRRVRKIERIERKK